MKTAILTIAALLCVSVISSAYGATHTGNDLLDYCKDGPITDMIGAGKNGYCMGYITGLADTLNTHRRVCFPNGVVVSQNMKVVIKYLENHPERLHEEQYYLVRDALMIAFPCK